jgi:hypothetical protein
MRDNQTEGDRFACAIAAPTGRRPGKNRSDVKELPLRIYAALRDLVANATLPVRLRRARARGSGHCTKALLQTLIKKAMWSCFGIPQS